jgi:hypothetical protein
VGCRLASLEEVEQRVVATSLSRLLVKGMPPDDALSTARTIDACQALPPCAVGTPSSLSVTAMAASASPRAS